jgi:uncharacterized protein YdaU (DUF1376 family)
MHYYQFNIGDYASHTSRLKPIEDLAYRRMLDLYYLNEQPLNLCLSDVAREIGLTDYLDEVTYVLNKFFIQTEFGFLQKRIDLEIKKYKLNHKSKIKAGKASAKARQVKASSVETPVEHPLNISATSDELNINHKTLTINHKTLTNNQELVVKDTGTKAKRFMPPSLDQVINYCNERLNNVDANKFIDHYTSNGWLVGKNKMKDWKAAVRTWEKSSFDKPKSSQQSQSLQTIQNWRPKQ